MPEEIRIAYGRGSLTLSFDRERVGVIGGTGNTPALSDAEIGAGLEAPIGSAAIEDTVAGGESVLLVVPDATRSAAAGQVANLLVRRLISAGVMPYDIAVLFATGIHRKVTEEEKQEILTPFLARRMRTIDHGPRDLMKLERIGETSSGIPVELNRALSEFDRVITIGSVTYHYFAGFTGGRKLICPGVASSRTIAASHKLAFDFQRLTRAEGVGPGRLEGNPVHEVFVEAVEMRPPDLAVSTIVDDAGAATAIFCGDWKESHEAACRMYSKIHDRPIEDLRPLVIAGCGGFPFDINLIQAHKALEAASRACVPGGRIVLFAECSEGTGRDDFRDWFREGSASAIARRLAEAYKVNGQTAWALREKTERFEVSIVTALPEGTVLPMGIQKIRPEEAEELLATADSAYLMPYGAKFLPVLGSG